MGRQSTEQVEAQALAQMGDLKAMGGVYCPTKSVALALVAAAKESGLPEASYEQDTLGHYVRARPPQAPARKR